MEVDSTNLRRAWESDREVAVADEATVERVRRLLAGRPAIAEKRMMGGPCCMINGSMCCCVSG